MSWILTAVMPSLSLVSIGFSIELYLTSFLRICSCMTSLDSFKIWSRKTAVPLRVDIPRTMPKLTCWSRSAHGYFMSSSTLKNCETKRKTKVGGRSLTASRSDTHLSQVEVLLTRDDVDHLVKVVLLPPLSGTGDIPRDVDISPVRLPHDRLAELVLLEVDDERALGLLDDPRRLELFDSFRLPGVRDLGFTRVDVKVDVEARVGVLVLDDREVAELAPERQSFDIAF